MEKIICPQCGAEATSDDFACPRCEALLNAAAIEDEPSSVVQALLSGNAPLRRPEPPTIPSGPPASPAPQARPAQRTIPRLKRGVDLALSPLSSFEAYLVSCIDGFLSIEEIAARAKLSGAELLLIFQGEALRDVVELHVESRPVGKVGEVVTQVEAAPLGAAPPALPPHPPLGVRITAPSTRELRSMSQPARGTPPTGELRPPPPPAEAARRPPPPPQPRTAPKSSAQLEGDEDLFQARAALSADGRIVNEPPTEPSPVQRPVQRPGIRETVTERAPPDPDAGTVDLRPAAPDEPPLELAREVRPRATGSAARRPSQAAPRARDEDSRAANESVLELASALESRGDVSGAIQILERAIASSNQPAPLYNRLALALVRRNNIARAVTLLEKAVAADPRNKTYARNLETVSQMRRK